MIGDQLRRLEEPRPLSPSDAHDLFGVLLAPETTELERVALLLATSTRRETGAELALLAGELRKRARPFPVAPRDGAVDLCGSGGARLPSFNISTVSAFVVAGAGLPVVKHGNRSARGPCGSTDLLLALGLPVDRSVEFARASYRHYHLAFLHAPLFHPATRVVAAARRALGVPTVFNRLGPLSNPAKVRAQVVGVPTVGATARAADALQRLGVERGLAMSSREGCDEFSPRRATDGVRWTRSGARRVTVHPERYLERDERSGAWGALPAPEAAEEAERVLAGGGGARRGSVLLTSGAALWVAGRARTLAEGVGRARDVLDGGEAEKMLARLRRLATQYPPGEAS